MTESNDRRTTETQRVPVANLVEICGNEPGSSAFEAEAVNLSRHGMQVRTAYLPEEGSPLVCRMVDKDREIIVEGVVAWRRGEGRGGEFGIQFTALDSGSVGALDELCHDGAPEPAREPKASERARPAARAGERVQLHVEGLAAPLKFKVRQTSPRRLDVASSLAYLKAGRVLEIDDGKGGERRAMRVESVAVAVDPETKAPQLMVTLRYDDAETTPEPSVIEAPVARRSVRSAADKVSGPLGAASDARVEDEPLDELDEDGDDEEGAAFKGKLSEAALRAGELAKQTGEKVKQLGGATAGGLGKLMRGAGEKLRELRERRAGAEGAAPPTRRQQGKPAGAGEVRKLRPQSSAARRDEAAANPEAKGVDRAKLRRYGGAAAALALLVTVGVVATSKPSAPPGAEAAVAAAAAAAASDDVVSVDETGNPVPQAAPSGSSGTGAGLSADIPLFGPTPLATLEPAPLGAPEEPAEGAGPNANAPPLGEEEQELAAAKATGASRLADERFAEEPEVEEPAAEAKPAKVDPASVAPWGRGKVSTPTIHRLRLDAPGGAIQGAITPTGFTVVIPGRRVMEGGQRIAGRDPRIAKVRTSNVSNGAQVQFQFKDGVPGYRVRLRKDYVEILISAPLKKSDAAPATKASKTKKKAS